MKALSKRALPKNLKLEHGQIYYGDILVATLHSDLNLLRVMKDPDALRRFGERNRRFVFQSDCNVRDKRRPKKS